MLSGGASQLNSRHSRSPPPPARHSNCRHSNHCNGIRRDITGGTASTQPCQMVGPARPAARLGAPCGTGALGRTSTARSARVSALAATMPRWKIVLLVEHAQAQRRRATPRRRHLHLHLLRRAPLGGVAGSTPASGNGLLSPACPLRLAAATAILPLLCRVIHTTGDRSLRFTVSAIWRV